MSCSAQTADGLFITAVQPVPVPADLQSASLFLHHLSHALAPFAVGDVDEVDSCWQAADVE